uniref:Uncharacterized protein n=1 Tax=Arundo donax TaxID=35708 RepID=A0A0A9AQB2_ARUDO
MRVGPASVRS